jgi:hypothetical protein
MDHDVAVKQSHEIEKTSGGKSVTVIPALVVVPATRKQDETVTFVTNLRVSDSTKFQQHQMFVTSDQMIFSSYQLSEIFYL